MRRRRLSLRTLYWATVGLLLGAILHIGYVLAAPYTAERTAWRQLSPQLPVNEMKVLPPIRPGAQPLPFLAPDVRYAMCRFDLGAGPLEIKTRLLDPTWSIALFTSQGENFSTFTTLDLMRSEAEMVVQPSAERTLLQAVQTFLTRTDRETRGQRDTGISIAAPTRQGIVVISAPVMGIAFQKETEVALAGTTCRPKTR
jgi:uncharacterized membrane protein